jgi:hypothetical protein
MNILTKILDFFSFLKTTSQLEYYIRSNRPQNHADLERLVRDYYSCRGM